MPRPRDLPARLGDVFHISDIQDAGVNPERMRRSDLLRPFAGVRARREAMHPLPVEDDLFARRRAELRAAAALYAPRLRAGQFFSHETAIALWDAPLPSFPSGLPPDVHVSVFGEAPLPRLPGVVAHRARAATSAAEVIDGLAVSTPATTWATSGSFALHDVVALGDFFCRRWRAGVGRPTPDRPPLATIDDLAAVVASGRRVGIPRLREALPLIREDAWSPRESRLRCLLHDFRLPEPALNVDVFDDDGRFLACLDLAFPAQKVGVEYHGLMHTASYARDVERIARLRAAGWTIIEVTAESLRDELPLIRRIRAALSRA
ncbi:hypothetical protein [uncultured Microbacterium sp.]|uniref:hypothetical protein n=1 Tax=uncultured Microbacterium sp. TaxID=191216 RepID=UPI0028DB45EE|nr:hypothetical protein [uncultured Microbacterium sp.]